MKTTTFACLAAAVVATSSSASIMKHTWTFTSAGALDGNTFDATTVTISALVDTHTLATDGSDSWVDHVGPASVSIAGLGTYTITDPASTRTLTNPATALLSLQRSSGQGSALLHCYSSDVVTWDLASPISATAPYFSGATTFLTSGGGLGFIQPHDPHFAAVRVDPTEVSFEFAAGLQGWRVYQVHYLGENLIDPQPLGGAEWDGTTGLPSGSLRVPDACSDTAVGICAEVAGNHLEWLGGELSFDILYRTRDEATYYSAGLYGGGLSLFVSEPPPELDTWLHRSYALRPGAWHVGSINGPLATQAEVQQVLSDFQGLFINTEWRTGPDDTSLDNVVLRGPQCATVACRADINRDGTVDGADMGLLLGAWGICTGPCQSDVNGDGTVDGADLGLLLGAWGPVP